MIFTLAQLPALTPFRCEPQAQKGRSCILTKEMSLPSRIYLSWMFSQVADEPILCGIPARFPNLLGSLNSREEYCKRREMQL